MVLLLGNFREDLGDRLPPCDTEIPDNQGRHTEAAPEGPEESDDLGLALDLELFRPEGEVRAGVPGPGGYRTAVDDGPVDREKPRSEAGEERPEPLLAEHPPPNEELDRETGDGGLGHRQVPAIGEKPGDLAFGEIEGEPQETDGQSHVGAKDVVGRGEGGAKGGAPSTGGMSLRTAPGRDGQSTRPLECEVGGRGGADDRPGRRTDRAWRGWEEEGRFQSRSSRVFSPRSKRIPTAESCSGSSSSPISATRSMTWAGVRVSAMMRLVSRSKERGGAVNGIRRGVRREYTGATGPSC